MILDIMTNKGFSIGVVEKREVIPGFIFVHFFLIHFFVHFFFLDKIDPLTHTILLKEAVLWEFRIKF